jgi:hypothetical protein
MQRLDGNDMHDVVVHEKHHCERKPIEKHAPDLQPKPDARMGYAYESAFREPTKDRFELCRESQRDRVAGTLGVVPHLSFSFIGSDLIDDNRAGHCPRTAR